MATEDIIPHNHALHESLGELPPEWYIADGRGLPLDAHNIIWERAEDCYQEYGIHVLAQVWRYDPITKWMEIETGPAGWFGSISITGNQEESDWDTGPHDTPWQAAAITDAKWNEFYSELMSAMVTVHDAMKKKT